MRPTYGILNGCPSLRTLSTGSPVISKRSAGSWGLEHRPEGWHAAIHAAHRQAALVLGRSIGCLDRATRGLQSPPMSETGNRAIVERFARAIEAKDFDTQATLLADDYIDEMPQSGERIRGKANARAIVDQYPGGVGTVDADTSHIVGADDRYVMTPTYSILRIEGSGDQFTYSGTVTYANGETWHIIAIVEVRSGRIARSTTYYAAPFEAPAWRAPYVERMGAPHG
jgi:limonene-1,2-epoxide hydrolase